MRIVRWIVSRLAFVYRSIKKQTSKPQQKEDKHTDINQIWEQFHKTCDEYNRNILMEHYLPVVKYVAESIHAILPPKVDLDDLISAGKKKENYLVEERKRRLKDLLNNHLTRAERLIVVFYYYEEMTMKEIGATLELSESRVSQMHSSIIARLKAKM